MSMCSYQSGASGKGTKRPRTPLLLKAAVASSLILGSSLARPFPRPETFAVSEGPDSVYSQLRNISVSGKVVAVKDFVLQRDAGKFTFISGNFFFLEPVQNKITGAVFVGTATFSLDPPIAVEKHSLELLTKSSEMNERFSTALFRFTDDTAQEIEAKGTPPTGSVLSSAEEILSDNRTMLRKHIQYNLDARILQDVLSDVQGGFFVAFIKGEKYTGKEIYVNDPHGVPSGLVGYEVAPEEVAFFTYADNKFGLWSAFHYSSEYGEGRASGRQPNDPVRILNQKLNVTVEKNGNMSAVAETTIAAVANGIRVVPLNLFEKLRVKSVTDESQHPLAFIQEKKDEDAQYSVILPHALNVGQGMTITTSYAGPDSVISTGFGNFFPVARTSWYPNSFSTGNYSTYDMTFRIPKGLTMVAAGEKVSDATDGDQNVTHWKSEVPIPVSGFNFGNFKKDDFKLEEQKMVLETYLNPDLTPEATYMMKKSLGVAQLAVPLYADFYGPISYPRIALTEQTARFGQSFATVVYLPITAYLSSQGLFLKSVGPHEVAHQWWGNMVGWDSYRDQWMGEGFAEFSATLFLQTYYKDGSYDRQWEDNLKLLTEKNREGFRAIDVGPVTMGYRLASTRAGFNVPRFLIYPKGAYILNMIRMMMWADDTGDLRFKTLMHDFTQFYANRPATTEDFKLAVEQHMTPEMNVAGDGKMDWFFDEYVFGTAIPTYRFDYSFTNAPDGALALNFKLTQSNVSDTFRMAVPIYIEVGDHQVARIGTVPMTGNTTFERQVVLRGISAKPKRASINYYHDVLCIQN
jgi:hypothetical protein